MSSVASKPDCLFCKIIAGDIPAKIVFQNDAVTVFEDIHPQAPTHLLVIPKNHVDDFQHADVKTLQAVGLGVQAVVKQLNLEDYRVAVNNGSGAGQSVFHLHFHVLAGRKFAWPPG